MLAHTPASPRRNCRPLPALACLSALALGVGQASALPRVDVGAVPGFLLVQEPVYPVPEEEAQATLADLNQVLQATRAKLEELFRATEVVAADTERRQAIQALQQENERLAVELRQASTNATELESSNERAEARIAELTKAVEKAVREAARIDEALAGQVRRNAELDQNLARADEAAAAEGEKIRVEMAAKLKAATDAAEESSAHLADLREELGEARKELATAKHAREQIETRVGALREGVERSATDAKRR